MKVTYPAIEIALSDQFFSRSVRLVQSHLIRHLDVLRNPKRTPYTDDFVRRMQGLGIDMDEIGWRGAMTFLPYRAEVLISQIEIKPPKRLLEVGAGSSTLLFSALAHKYGFEVVSLENHGGSVEYVDSLLRDTPFSDHVNLQICNFRRRCYPDNKPYWWYAADLSGEPFDFVFVDGPMSSLVGRNGALPEVMPFLSKDARLFLDDVNRPHEKRHWKSGVDTSQMF